MLAELLGRYLLATKWAGVDASYLTANKSFSAEGIPQAEVRGWPEPVVLDEVSWCLGRFHGVQKVFTNFLANVLVVFRVLLVWVFQTA